VVDEEVSQGVWNPEDRAPPRKDAPEREPIKLALLWRRRNGERSHTPGPQGWRRIIQRRRRDYGAVAARQRESYMARLKEDGESVVFASASTRVISLDANRPGTLLRDHLPRLSRRADAALRVTKPGSQRRHRHGGASRRTRTVAALSPRAPASRVKRFYERARTEERFTRRCCWRKSPVAPFYAVNPCYMSIPRTLVVYLLILSFAAAAFARVAH